MPAGERCADRGAVRLRSTRRVGEALENQRLGPERIRSELDALDRAPEHQLAIDHIGAGVDHGVGSRALCYVRAANPSGRPDAWIERNGEPPVGIDRP